MNRLLQIQNDLHRARRSVQQSHRRRPAGSGSGRPSPARRGPSSAGLRRRTARGLTRQPHPSDAVYTVVDPDAWLRDPENGFAPINPDDPDEIPQWTNVRILDERTYGDNDTPVVLVVRANTVRVEVLGWTNKANLYKFFRHNIPATQGLAPDTPMDLSRLRGAERNVARAYNRIGGLLEYIEGEVGLDVEVSLAIWSAESAGADFTPGRTLIRLENHVLWDEWGAQNPQTFNQHFDFNRSGPRSGGHRICESGDCESNAPDSCACGQDDRPATCADQWWNLHPSCAGGVTGETTQNLQYRGLDLARRLAGDETGLRSISIGGPQIMGYNHEMVGYPSARAMHDDFQASERAQVGAFVDYMRRRTENGRTALQHAIAEDWTNVALAYNGSDTYAESFQEGYDAAQAVLAAHEAALSEGRSLRPTAFRIPSGNGRSSGRARSFQTNGRSSELRRKFRKAFG